MNPTPSGEPKLDYDQRQEVNRLMEEAQDDLEGVLFRLVAALASERKLREDADIAAIAAVGSLMKQLEAAVEALRDLYENPSPKTARQAQSVLAEVADEHP